MVICQLLLISLKPGVSIPAFLRILARAGVKPVFQARILRWMILPRETSAGHLLARNIRWDLLLALEGSTGPAATIPTASRACIAACWTATCGVSARALSGYPRLNVELLTQSRTTAPPAPELSQLLSSSSTSSQDLQSSREWVEWMATLPLSAREHPVSMLNLLAFHPGMKEQYAKYGAEFSRRVGARHGGRVKLVGRVLAHGPGVGDGSDSDVGAGGGGDVSGEEEEGGWDEIAYVHYPTIRHFAAMAASEDYQEVNRRYRLGALRDTFILCCQEIDDDGELVGAVPGSSRL
ncbi:hypothetical protein VTH82DRAFT_3322 [Thermothelomyces myriococcoides]